jgi:hypothetical protein
MVYTESIVQVSVCLTNASPVNNLLVRITMNYEGTAETKIQSKIMKLQTRLQDYKANYLYFVIP